MPLYYPGCQYVKMYKVKIYVYDVWHLNGRYRLRLCKCSQLWVSVVGYLHVLAFWLSTCISMFLPCLNTLLETIIWKYVHSYRHTNPSIFKWFKMKIYRGEFGSERVKTSYGPKDCVGRHTEMLQDSALRPKIRSLLTNVFRRRK
jgi:hypothetical protein